jgi:pyruvate,water dikinase
MAAPDRTVVWFEELDRRDVPRVGGKNASLGEMVRHLGARGVVVPSGFATTAEAYWRFVASGLQRDDRGGARRTGGQERHWPRPD